MICLQACAQDVADLYAEEGTERCAGMTWDQQEALRERQQDAEIAARVRAFNSVPYRMPLPYLPRYKASSYECWQCKQTVQLEFPSVLVAASMARSDFRKDAQ